MSTSQSSGVSLDDILNAVHEVPSNDRGASAGGSVGIAGVPFKEPGYDGTIDYRIRQLSYSSLLTLHSCPRKFELYKRRSTRSSEESESSSITFAYGHIIGEGIQLVLQGIPKEKIWMKLLTLWKPELFAIDERQNKSFWMALEGVNKFISMRNQGFLEDYELVYYQGQPAVELSFCINFPDGFRLRGFVDAVLRNKITGKIIVLECKSTSVKLNPATYKNSAQAIGYSIVLDSIFPDLSAYEVLYLVYHSKDQDYTPIVFPKSYLQRALWIRELLLDIDVIKMYEEAEVYPMHGESCLNWGRECEYFQVCQLSTSHLTNACTPEEEDKTEYQISLSLSDLLESQFSKTE